MSHSQKHAGKVLVPWFNIAEWQHVYELIYAINDDKTLQRQNQALEILKVWKARLPLLSAGVEGTLIVLEAICACANNKLPDGCYAPTQICATALVRFLNICAAGGDKQGTFYKAALKNELPQWLVDVRHDIAHSQTMPSVQMLVLALNYSLAWLKDKYWTVQPEFMANLTVEPASGNRIAHATYSYVYLIYQLFRESDRKKLTRELKYHINRTIDNDLNQTKLRCSPDLLVLVAEQVRELFRLEPEKTADNICGLLVDNNCLILSIEPDLDADGKRILPKSFQTIWLSLLNLLHETQTLWVLVKKLFDFTRDNEHADDEVRRQHSEIASLWIYEIYRGLLCQHKEEDECVIKFKNETHIVFNDKNLMESILEHPNNYTLNYLKVVMIYNKASPRYIEDAINLVTALIQVNRAANNYNNTNNNIISTVNLLNIPFDIGNSNGNKESDSISSICASKQRWRVIEDTSMYENCPLGLLPHQSRETNPLLPVL